MLGEYDLHFIELVNEFQEGFAIELHRALFAGVDS